MKRYVAKRAHNADPSSSNKNELRRLNIELANKYNDLKLRYNDKLIEDASNNSRHFYTLANFHN